MRFHFGHGHIDWAKRKVRHLAGNERGVSIIELAIAAPLLGLFVVGVADLGRGFSERYFLQQAANRAIELGHLGTIGKLGTTGVDFNHLIPEAAAAAKVPESNVTLEHWLECDGTKQAFNTSCTSGQRVARYIKLTIRSSFKPMFGTAGYPNAQEDGTVPISANASLRVQ